MSWSGLRGLVPTLISLATFFISPLSWVALGSIFHWLHLPFVSVATQVTCTQFVSLKLLGFSASRYLTPLASSKAIAIGQGYRLLGCMLRKSAPIELHCAMNLALTF